MAIFFPLPPPIFISATGGQPYAPSHLAPSIDAVPVNNPPPQVLANLFMAAVLAWQPGPPQPQRPPAAQMASAAIVNNPPPFVSQAQSIIQAWRAPDPAPTQRRTSFTIGIRVDTPVPFSTPWLSTILSSWQPPAPAPSQRQITQTVGIKVDDPAPWAQQAAPSAWWVSPPAPLQVRLGQLAPPPIVGQVPAGVASWQPALAAWFATTTWPQQPQPHLIAGISVDNPVPGLPAAKLAALAGWWMSAAQPLQLAAFSTPQSAIAPVPVASPAWLTAVASWRGADPAPQQQLPHLVVGIRVDAPPVRRPVVFLIDAWQPSYPPQQSHAAIPSGKLFPPTRFAVMPADIRTAEMAVDKRTVQMPVDIRVAVMPPD